MELKRGRMKQCPFQAKGGTIPTNIRKEKDMTELLNGGYLKLVDKMGSDLSVVNAARISYGTNKTALDKSDEKLINYLAKNSHYSPFRHVMVSVAVKIPLPLARQWFKHVVGGEYQYKDTGWNEKSYRYKEVDDNDYYFPEEWRKQHESSKQASEGVLNNEDTVTADGEYYNAISNAFRAYRSLLDLGVCREQARMVLPQAVYTEFQWTASLEAMVHFVKLRNVKHMNSMAQKEIELYALELELLLKSLFPISYHALLKNKGE